ncbi:unnamed protein product [Peniophora sp. CBMAI 1063]|nr:unnamed protein product [Peniophora sp. CBMAI 1063]
MESKNLALAEEAATRLRTNGIMEQLGPRIFDTRPWTGDHTKLADGLRFEAGIQAAISGALAIRGVPPINIHRSVGAALQDASFNSADGGYDILEAEHREIEGPHGRWGIPESRSAPRTISDITAFVRSIGLTVDLDAWWESGESVSLEGEAAQAAIAVNLMITTERFAYAPPIKTHGRDGDEFILAPDLVNTVEHLDAQMKQLRQALESRRRVLQFGVAQSEDRLLAAYRHLYKGAPAAAPEINKVDKYFLERGEIYGGTEMMKTWIADRSSRVSGLRTA